MRESETEKITILFLEFWLLQLAVQLICCCCRFWSILGFDAFYLLFAVLCVCVCDAGVDFLILNIHEAMLHVRLAVDSSRTYAVVMNYISIINIFICSNPEQKKHLHCIAIRTLATIFNV